MWGVIGIEVEEGICRRLGGFAWYGWMGTTLLGVR